MTTLEIGFMALGGVAQALFFARTFWQWFASERRGEVVIPRYFWHLSLLAAMMLLAYAAWRRDPVFVAGTLVSCCIFGRNLYLQHASRDGAITPTPVWALGPAALLMIGLLGVQLSGKLGVEFFDFRRSGAIWLVIGGLGMGLWQARNVIQWWISERRGKSVLPARYFGVAVFGGILMLIYAISRLDPIFIAGYVLSPIPYARNLWLILRQRRRVAVPNAAAAVIPGETEHA